MLKIFDKVMVLENKKVLGFASVTDVCENIEDLNAYFAINHPKRHLFQMAIENNESIYIVEFDNEGGQGGYLKKNLKKIYKKRISMC